MRLIAALDSMPPWLRSGLAVMCLLGAAIIVSLPYSIPGWIWDRHINYRPTAITGTIAAAPMLALFLADLFVLHPRAAGWLAITMNVISALAVLYVVAAFAAIGTGGNSWTSGPTGLLALVVVALSILDARRYGELAAIALMILVGWNLNSASVVMGTLGFCFVALTFLGLVLTLDIGRICRLILSRRPVDITLPVAIDAPPPLLTANAPTAGLSLPQAGVMVASE